MIVATAGHVDHGKTSIVRALTGVDTDRLAEEKARGLTIELGFAYRNLDSGGRIGFVDVPGHERFVHTMAAGVGGVDCALLVVAADDGIMPQTREHVAILDFMGVRRCIVAINKIDRSEPDRVRDVIADVEGLLAGTSLVDGEIIPVSAHTGDGMDLLLLSLSEIALESGTVRVEAGFRMPVDRAFSLQGAGLVLTGTCQSGRVRIGDHLKILPSGRAVRVRALHTLNQDAEEGHAGQRLGVNVSGTDLKDGDLWRGCWLAEDGAGDVSSCLDVSLRLPADATAAFRGRGRFHVHIGTADIQAGAQVLKGGTLQPGEAGYVRLRLDRPVQAAFGDRLILRDASARRTIAGGRVVDPQAPLRRRRGEDREAFLQAMDHEDPAEAFSALLVYPNHVVDAAAFAKTRNIPLETVTEIATSAGAVAVGGGAYTSAGVFETICQQVLAKVQDWHRAHPDHIGMPIDKLFRPGLPELNRKVWTEACTSLVEKGVVRRLGSMISASDHQADFEGGDKALWGKVEKLLRSGGKVPPRVVELAEVLDMRAAEVSAFLRRAARIGKVHPVADNRFFLPDALDDLAAVAKDLDADRAGFDAKSFRDAAEIGRNLAIEVLEYFDALQLTQRVGDRRHFVAGAQK